MDSPVENGRFWSRRWFCGRPGPRTPGLRRSSDRPGLLALSFVALLATASPLGSARAAPGTAAADSPESAAAGPVLASYIPLFGTREVRSSDLKAFKQWLSVMDRESRDRPYMDKACPDDSPQLCLLREWKAFLEGIKNKDRMAQVQEVNGYMNTHPYLIDAVNWGAPDYWEVPREFLDRSGDCEDYAIAKFYSLRWLGMTDSELRVVVLQDLNLQVPHAVLAAYLEGNIYVLDNQIPQVVTADIIKHYRPFYSINEVSWWLHRPR